MNLAVSAQRRWPRWLAGALGVITALVGLTLLTRPFQSLAILILLVALGFILTGLIELAGRSEALDKRLATAIGIVWVAAGIAILLWPGLSLRTLALLVGVALIVGGITRLLPAIRGDVDERASAALLGVAGIVLGVVSLGWPDVTLLVVAVVFGLQLILFGLARIGDAIRSRPRLEAHERPGRLRRWTKTAAAAGALLISLALMLVSARLNQGAPVVDAFYKAPADVPAAPGQLVRSEAFDRALPAGAQAWRILYTTTRGDGSPALGSALVIAPTAPSSTPRPVIAWTHGTTGVDQTCAPSLLENPFEAGAMFNLDQVIANGWVMVATDYIGLGTQGPHAYLIGQDEGRASLDAVRAAHQMPELSLDERTVAWGHSQGGHAALWTGIIAPTYAPDDNVIGVAALAPASDLAGLAGGLGDLTGGEIFASYIIQGYSDHYPDVRFDDYIRPTARIAVREIASRCLAEPEVFVSVATVLVIDKSIWQSEPTTGALGARLAENVPRGTIPMPLLLAQGLTDPLVLPDVQATYAASKCQGGGPVEYRAYEDRGHVGLVAADSPLIPDLIAWTKDRLAGMPATSTCPD